MRVSAEDRKEQLIAATMELMRREGVQAVTMRAIAKEANAPLAAANYCFGNKDELMDAAADAWLKNLNSFSSDIPAHLGLRQAVEEVAKGYWRALEEEPASMLAEKELILWAARNGSASPLAPKIYPAYEGELEKIFSAATHNTDSQSLLDIPTLARSFLMIYDGAALQYMTHPKAPHHRTHYFMMVDALLIKAGL